MINNIESFLKVKKDSTNDPGVFLFERASYHTAWLKLYDRSVYDESPIVIGLIDCFRLEN